MNMPTTLCWWEYSILWNNPHEGCGTCLTRGGSPISRGQGKTGRRSSRCFLQGLPLGHTCTNCSPTSNSTPFASSRSTWKHFPALCCHPLAVYISNSRLPLMTAPHLCSQWQAIGRTVADTQDWTVRKEKGSAVWEMRAVEESDSILTLRD